MAHKVLSKDMKELVAAMKLAQSYSHTIADSTYSKYVCLTMMPNRLFQYYFRIIQLFFFRSMLSSAHVLAMDAKNLLDVVDSVRIRYPEVDKIIKTNGRNLTGIVQNPSNTSAEETQPSGEVPRYGMPSKVTEHITAS